MAERKCLTTEERDKILTVLQKVLDSMTEEEPVEINDEENETEEEPMVEDEILENEVVENEEEEPEYTSRKKSKNNKVVTPVAVYADGRIEPNDSKTYAKTCYELLTDLDATKFKHFLKTALK